MSYEKLVKKVWKMQKQYLVHKCEVFNGMHHWPVILSTTSEMGLIYHMDFSENTSQMHKFEPQSSHFNKAQYSLHCTVRRGANGSLYLYHLSDEKRHDYAFTATVVEHIISIEEENHDILRFKSDNCSTQYKSKYVFNFWSSLAKKLNKTIIVYYGVSGYGKGLVDAMSGFGVKGAIRRAVVTKNFSFTTAEDIHNYLYNFFEIDEQKEHCLVTPEAIHSKRSNDKLKIDGCIPLHMFCYSPDGSIQLKRGICSCSMCKVGKFIDCSNEKGVIIYPRRSNQDESSSSSSDIEDSDRDDKVEEIDVEQYKMRSASISEIVETQNIVALFAPVESFEMIYLCKVISIEVGENEIIDDYHHTIQKGSVYLKCHYLEKFSEKRSKVGYKLLSKNVFVLPSQVMNPLVEMNDKLELSITEYQWLIDSI